MNVPYILPQILNYVLHVTVLLWLPHKHKNNHMFWKEIPEVK